MKTRTGFVSNSSSSSYIVSYLQKDDTCPHCGRHDPNFLDLLRRSSNCRSEETELHYDNKQDVLENLDERIASVKGGRAQYEGRDPQEITSRYPIKDWSTNQVTGESIIRVGDQLRWYTEELEQVESLRARVNAAQEPVISFSISYHDEVAKDTLENLIRSGQIIIIDGDED